MVGTRSVSTAIQRGDVGGDHLFLTSCQETIRKLEWVGDVDHGRE